MRFHHYASRVADLVAKLQSTTNDRYVIPEHQREYCWTVSKAQEFLLRVLMNRPIPNILVRRHDDGTISLEDGRQRLTTLRYFMEGSLRLKDGRAFAELDPEERAEFKNYQVAVTEYSHATNEEAIQVFDEHQNGMPLTVGERLHSLQALSPIVQYAKRMLLTEGAGLHDRAKAVWGTRCAKDKRYANLKKAYALCAGLAFGPSGMSLKWDDVRDIVKKSFDEAATTARLEALLGILEQVQARHAITAQKRGKQFSIGDLLGYMAYSLFTYANDTQRIVDGWVNYLARARADPSINRAELHADVTKARSWTPERWEMGYLRVFDPEEAVRRALERAGIVSNASTSSEEEEVETIDDEVEADDE